MPNRTLKESIRESESIDKLSHAAECTWYRLITYVDDYGLFKGNIRLINRALFPLRDYSDGEVAGWLRELEDAGMIAFYIVDGKPYGAILNWEIYNKPRNSKPKYPQPTDDTAQSCSLHAIENSCMQLNANGPVVEVEVEVESRGQPAPACKPKQKNQTPKSNGKYPPPNREDVIAYFTENGYATEAAEKAFQYYEAHKDPHSGNWKDSKGNIVKAWKQKMVAVWFKSENRAPPKNETAKPFDPEEERRKLEEAMK